jgi:hypothetical protein
MPATTELKSNYNVLSSLNTKNHNLQNYSQTYTIIVPTKCTSLFKAQDITILYFFVFVFLAPTCFVPRGTSSGGAMPVPN